MPVNNISINAQSPVLANVTGPHMNAQDDKFNGNIVKLSQSCLSALENLIAHMPINDASKQEHSQFIAFCMRNV